MKHILPIVVGVVAIVLIVVFSGVGPTQQSIEKKVAATIFPLYDITRVVAGEDMEVELILPPGASPHTFEFQPSDIRRLEGATTLFAIGHGLDEWAQGISSAIDASVVVVDDNIVLRESAEEEEHEDEEHEHEHEHGPEDPHYWLSSRNAAQIAETVGRELSRLDPDNAERYMSRAKEYAQEIRALPTANGDVLPVISLHDAWYYFADEHSLEIVGTFEPSAGKEPSAQYLANLGREVKEHDVSFVIVEPRISTKAIEAFAEDLDLTLIYLDPLGGVEGRMSYLELMRYNIQNVQNARHGGQ